LADHPVNLVYDVENSFDFNSGGAEERPSDQLFNEFGLSGYGGGESHHQGSLPPNQPIPTISFRDYGQTPANTPTDHPIMPLFEGEKAVRKRPSKESSIKRELGAPGNIPSPIKVRNPDAGIVCANGKIRDVLYQCPKEGCGKRNDHFPLIY
jgi:hypothetical protein